MSMANGTPYKRSYLGHFIDENFGTTPHYVRLGADVESAKLDPGINTEKKTNILDEVSVRISEYTPTLEISSYVCKKGDALWEKLYTNYQNRATASQYETTMVDVIFDSEGNIEKAHKTTVRIIPTSFGGDGGVELECPFTVNYTGTPVSLTVANVTIANGVLTISSGG